MKKEGRNQTITAGSLGLTSEVRSRNQYLIHRWEKCPVDIRLASRCNMNSLVDFKEESKVSNVKSRTERHFLHAYVAGKSKVVCKMRRTEKCS